MALSNMSKEPAREIAESLVGLLALFCILAPTYCFSQYCMSFNKTPDIKYSGVWWFDTAGTMLMILGGGVIGVITLQGFLKLTHAWGDDLCDLLDKVGLDPRPKIRNIKWWWNPDPRIAQKAALEAQIAELKTKGYSYRYDMERLENQLRALGI